MTRFGCLRLALVFAAPGLALPAAAAPRVPVAPHVYAGLFGKIRLPRINIGKGVKAVVYPVTKATVNGGKAAISGVETSAKVYGAYKTLNPNAKGIPAIPRLK